MELHHQAAAAVSITSRLLFGVSLGWADDRNVRMDFRWPGADINRIRALGQELVRLQPDIILATGTPATTALQRETRTIPIIFVNVADPVPSGIVTRLDRPDGNITGFANYETSLGAKWLELLSEIAPGLKRAYFLPSFEAAARSLRVVPIIAHVHNDVEIEAAITALGREPGSGLVVHSDGFMLVHRAPVILAAARNDVPAVYTFSYYARDGGLLSYGPDPVDLFRRAASYIDRILRGAKPSDLPVQFPKRASYSMYRKRPRCIPHEKSLSWGAEALDFGIE
jgi:putative ABC transport system substrate-binding protein